MWIVRTRIGEVIDEFREEWQAERRLKEYEDMDEERYYEVVEVED